VKKLISIHIHIFYLYTLHISVLLTGEKTPEGEKIIILAHFSHEISEIEFFISPGNDGAIELGCQSSLTSMQLLPPVPAHKS
jgi:hypothetical protein